MISIGRVLSDAEQAPAAVPILPIKAFKWDHLLGKVISQLNWSQIDVVVLVI